MTTQLTDKALEQIRKGALVRPRGPRPGQQWTPRTAAEEHLLREASRLERVRQMLLGEVGRLRHKAAAGSSGRRDHIEQAARSADRLADCPLTPAQLAILAAAAAGEDLQDTGRRTLIAYDKVVSHRKRAVARLGARGTTHAVAICVAAGWITREQIALGVSP